MGAERAGEPHPGSIRYKLEQRNFEGKSSSLQTGGCVCTPSHLTVYFSHAPIELLEEESQLICVHN